MSSPATAETIAPGFSSRRQYDLTIPAPEGDKHCSVRFPTDEEWCQRARQQTAIRRTLGRDATRTEVKGDTDTAKELFDKIVIGDEPGIDEYEALQIVTMLGRCEIFNVTREGGCYGIEMKVPGASVKHRLKIPTQRQIFEHGRSALHVTGRRNSVEIKSALEPSGELWDKIVDSVSGYRDGGPVPIIHKDVALTELLAQISAEIEAGVSPEA